MGWKSLLLKPVAYYISKKIERDAKTAIEDQHRIFQNLIQKGSKTKFGIDHNFNSIQTPKDFAKHVPIRDYEGLKHYVQLIIDGGQDVLWPGKPSYFAKTSGTTSGVKYIPLTEDSIPNHINTARNALISMCYKAGILDVFDGKVIFLSGSPTLITTGGIPTGRLSGIVNHKIPSWLRGNQLPSYKTNCIEDWEEKVDNIVDETVNQDMRLISGIPPWVQMYYEQLINKTGKENIISIFPNLKIFVYGGVNFEPYRQKMESIVGRKLIGLETYPASEGFIAFQDEVDSNHLLLNSNSGIFFEFIPLENVFDENPLRLTLEDVEIGIDYAVIINNNAGLWAYNIGDTIRFVSKSPYRLVVSGRIKHFISAFGEHVIGKEVDEAIKVMTTQTGCRVVEATVAPQIHPKDGGLPYHEWFIEFDNQTRPIAEIEDILDAEMIKQNIYYKDLIEGQILRPLRITLMQKNGFRNYMKDQGKLGGQNKVPRLANDRKLVQGLSPYILNVSH